MAHFMPPALLQLFTPRPTLDYNSLPRKKIKLRISGFAEYAKFFIPQNNLPVIEKIESAKERKNRLKKLRIIKNRKILNERIKTWDPHNNKFSTVDAYKTLFVARLNKNLTENDLKDEFQKYGDVNDVKLIKDNLTKKSRGYAFIEFKSSQDLKDAFKYADNKKIKGKRILVDVERGRTVPNWKPKKLGGGMSSNRELQKKQHSTTIDKSQSRKVKYRDKDKRDRRRRRSHSHR